MHRVWQVTTEHSEGIGLIRLNHREKRDALSAALVVRTQSAFFWLRRENIELIPTYPVTFRKEQTS